MMLGEKLLQELDEQIQIQKENPNKERPLAVNPLATCIVGLRSDENMKLYLVSEVSVMNRMVLSHSSTL